MSVSESESGVALLKGILTRYRLRKLSQQEEDIENENENHNEDQKQVESDLNLKLSYQCRMDGCTMFGTPENMFFCSQCVLLSNDLYFNTTKEKEEYKQTVGLMRRIGGVGFMPHRLYHALLRKFSPQNNVGMAPVEAFSLLKSLYKEICEAQEDTLLLLSVRQSLALMRALYMRYSWHENYQKFAAVVAVITFMPWKLPRGGGICLFPALVQCYFCNNHESPPDDFSKVRYLMQCANVCNVNPPIKLDFSYTNPYLKW